jgi:hypothetical protein
MPDGHAGPLARGPDFATMASRTTEEDLETDENSGTAMTGLAIGV